MVGGVPDVITCAKFQIEISMGYDFTGGQIFDFCIDFSMGLTTVQRYCAACDDKHNGSHASNSISAGTSPQILLEELITLPDDLAAFGGNGLKKGRVPVSFGPKCRL